MAKKNTLSNRFFIEMSFNGTAYHGWQVQPNGCSVQGTLNRALKTLLREDILTTGAGRTDAGVHASYFIAHFNAFKEDIDVDSDLLYRINRILPVDIAVKRFIKVDKEAHARFDATSRSYQYVISRLKNPFNIDLSYYNAEELNIQEMNKAAGFLSYYRDFSCFSKSHTDVKTNNCLITHAEWVLIDNMLIFNISADRFLRNMVRAITGTMLEIGRGKIKSDYINSIIESKDRSNAGMSVPAEGLFLTDIKYPYIIRE